MLHMKLLYGTPPPQRVTRCCRRVWATDHLRFCSLIIGVHLKCVAAQFVYHSTCKGVKSKLAKNIAVSCVCLIFSTAVGIFLNFDNAGQLTLTAEFFFTYLLAIYWMLLPSPLHNHLIIHMNSFNLTHHSS